ncbi:putative oxidoreductase domain protein [Burkholderia pseudomallei]|nr:putative oxidoreductase domain protein [Burkholderia pseudomallei]
MAHTAARIANGRTRRIRRAADADAVHDTRRARVHPCRRGFLTGKTTDTIIRSSALERPARSQRHPHAELLRSHGHAHALPRARRTHRYRRVHRRRRPGRPVDSPRAHRARRARHCAARRANGRLRRVGPQRRLRVRRL